MTVAAAMVLAAGRGRRMQPLTRVVPKPALPLGDGPVVASAIRLAAATSERPVVVNTWHLAEVMERALDELRPGIGITVSREPELMDTAGGLALARERGLLGDDGPVLVVNGDGLLDLDPARLFDRMAAADDLVTLALLPHPDPSRWSRVVLDPTGAVRRIEPPGAPATDGTALLYPGVMLVARDALSALPVRPGAIAENLWRPALAARRLGGVVVTGSWREVGTPPDYLDAVLDGLAGGRVLHPTAEVHPTAGVTAALVGRGARIGAGASVFESVVAEGAVVGPGARLERSVLLGAVTAERQESVVDEVRARPV